MSDDRIVVQLTPMNSGQLRAFADVTLCMGVGELTIKEAYVRGHSKFMKIQTESDLKLGTLVSISGVMYTIIEREHKGFYARVDGKISNVKLDHSYDILLDRPLETSVWQGTVGSLHTMPPMGIEVHPTTLVSRPLTNSVTLGPFGVKVLKKEDV